ncbi:MAG: isoprenylcysteine carboxylmethyltransferase family protein [Promethearchaeia archaeon]
MKFLPELGVGWFYGWIYFIFYLIVFGIILKICPEEVRKRLYDRSLWDKKTKIITTIGKSFSLVNIIMILFGQLQIGSIEFIIGTIIYFMGLGMLVIAIIHYRDAPLDKPIKKGVYKYSRNPQMVAIFILFLGMILTVGAWLNLIFLGITIIFSHFSILAEEKALAEQYGESYLEYKEEVQRYFIFF